MKSSVREYLLSVAGWTFASVLFMLVRFVGLDSVPAFATLDYASFDHASFLVRSAVIGFVFGNVFHGINRALDSPAIPQRPYSLLIAIHMLGSVVGVTLVLIFLSVWQHHEFSLAAVEARLFTVNFLVLLTYFSVTSFAFVLVRTLKGYVEALTTVTAEKARIESELQLARDIQMSMVPMTFPPFPSRPEVDVHAALIPAREVGGDFYDFFFIDEDHLFVAVGDVSGKGVPAALFMALTATVLRVTGGGQKATVDTLMSQVNAEVCRGNDACMFVTAFCGILNVPTGQFDYSNAGHNLPYLVSNGVVTALPKTKGIALGVADSVRYQSGTLNLKAGDRLVMFTDGVTEAMDTTKQLFSEGRLESTLQGAEGQSSQGMTAQVVRDVQQFAHGAEQSDDITLLVLGYHGPRAASATDHAA